MSLDESVLDTSLEAVLLQHQVEQFYYREAELLDTWRWSEWLKLFADDIRYWMPVRKNRLRRQRGEDQVPAGIHMAHIDDDLRMLSMRVRQLDTGRHWAEDPPSRTRHLVSNVRLRPAEVDGELQVRTNFICYRNRLESEVDIWAGERIDVLRPVDSDFVIASRTVLLDQNVILSKNLSVFF